jgi:hypothetical protein
MHDHCDGCGGNKPQGDLISRVVLLEAIRKRLGISSLNFLTEQERVVVEEIFNAPTIKQEVKLVPVAKVTFDEEKLREIVHREVIDKIQSGDLVVQAEERKIGKWVKNIYPDGSYNFICLACNTTSAEDSQYCQNCGAYMIKENEDG